MGGHHATVLPDDFARPFVDVIFLGAADDSFREFVARSESGRPVEEVPNIAFVREGALRFTDRAPAAQNLDLLPFPDRRLTREYRGRYRTA